MSSENLLKLLALSNLEHLLPQLVSMGVKNFQELAQLEYSDYPKAGVVTVDEFENLNELVTHLREELGHSSYSQQSSNTNTNTISISNDGNSINSNTFQHEHEQTSFINDYRQSYEESAGEVLYRRTPKKGQDYEYNDNDNDNGYSANEESLGSVDNLYESEYTDDNDYMVTSDSEISFNHRNLQLSINNGIEDDLLEPQRVIRLGTSNKNALLNAYGVPIKQKTTSTIGPDSAGKKRADSKVSSPRSVTGQITVCVRKRPLSNSEKQRSEADIVSTSTKMLAVLENKKKVDLTKYVEEHRFCFDRVFNENDTNQDVYNNVISPLVDHIFTGGNATCFAYGQTGSGKTHTMLDSKEGLYVLAGHHIFERLKHPKYKDLQVVVVFYEIYLNDVYDLLNNRNKLHAREKADRNVCIKDIAEVSISSVADLRSVFEFGNKNRSIGSTGANSDSSRSHAIMQIELRKKSDRSSNGVSSGKLSFIDLAGNERGADRGEAQNDSTTRREGSEINKSLLALKECIRSLDLGKSHQPFRQSRLTLVLRDSFIGDSMCCMIATVAPNNSNCEHTLNTLRYADRVKSIQNRVSSPQAITKLSPLKAANRYSAGARGGPTNKKILSLPVSQLNGSLSKPNMAPSQLNAHNRAYDSYKSSTRQSFSHHNEPKLSPPKSSIISPSQIDGAKLDSSNAPRTLSASAGCKKPVESTLRNKTQQLGKLNSSDTFQRRQSIGQRRPRESSVGSEPVSTKSSMAVANSSLAAMKLKSQTTRNNFHSKPAFSRPALNIPSKPSEKPSSAQFDNKAIHFKSLNISERTDSRSTLSKGLLGSKATAGKQPSPTKNNVPSQPSLGYSQSTGHKPTTDQSSLHSGISRGLTTSNRSSDDSASTNSSPVTFSDNHGSNENSFEHPNKPDSDNVLEQVNFFTKQHMKHIHFLKKACREEVLSMVMYNTFNKNKTSQLSSRNQEVRQLVESGNFRKAEPVTPTSRSPKNDDILSPTSKSFENKYTLEDLFEVYQSSSSRDVVVRRRQDGMIFKSLDEAQKQTAHEYLLQLDCILEAEMEEIMGMRMELSGLLSKHF